MVDAPAHFHKRLWRGGPSKHLRLNVSDLDLKPGDLLTVSQFMHAAERSGIYLQEGDIALIEFGVGQVPARWK